MSEEKNKGGRKDMKPITQHLFEPPVESQASHCKKHDEVCYPHVGCLSCYVEIVNIKPLTGDADGEEENTRTVNFRAGSQVF